jgi:aminopeptidase
MKDSRYTDLAKLLVRYSTRLQRGERCLVEAFDIPPEFTVELIRQIDAVGAEPVVSTYHQPVLRALYSVATESQMKAIGQVERLRMENVQAYIGVRGSHNISETSDIPRERMTLY